LNAIRNLPEIALDGALHRYNLGVLLLAIAPRQCRKDADSK
jgi:hypothetical protein